MRTIQGVFMPREIFVTVFFCICICSVFAFDIIHIHIRGICIHIYFCEKSENKYDSLFIFDPFSPLRAIGVELLLSVFSWPFGELRFTRLPFWRVKVHKVSERK